jgi:protein O-mannosyl-transferase
MLNKTNISPGKKKLIVYVFLTVVTLAVYWQVNQLSFINYDDDVYVTKNLHVQSGITIDGIRWAFSTTYAEFWHPLTWLSLMLDHQLYGLNAGGYHLTNLILHTMSVLLLFLLFNRMTADIWKSAFVAALFALHPLRVESVAWVSERKDVLSAFFWMLTLCLYAYYTEKSNIKRYLPVLVSFICGLMSKSMVVTLPVVLILLDYWPLKRFASEKGNLILWQLREKTPFFIFSAIFSVVTIHAQSRLHIEYPLVDRIANSLVSFVAYPGKILCPHDLALVYPFPNQLPAWQVTGAALLIVAISALTIAAVRRFPYLLTGWMWYAITVLPVIGIISVGDPMADRYIYLPSIGIAVMLAWGVPLLIRNEALRKKILFPAGIGALAILSILTWKQCDYWKTSAGLFNHTLRVTKNNYLAHNNLGLALMAEGKINEAIEQYNKGIRIMPYVLIYINRGVAYGELGQYKQAIDDFDHAIRLNPGYQIPYYNKGVVYGKLGRYKQAIEEFNKAISRNPEYAEGYYRRGVAYILQGNYQDGCRDAQKACELENCQLLEYAKAGRLCP